MPADDDTDRLPGEVTRILNRIDGGGRDALAELLPLVYDELRRLAGSHLRKERADHTLQPTALVHEAWVRMMGRVGSGWTDRAHFFRAAATVMRYILVDHARQRSRQKRDPQRVRIPLDENVIVFEQRATDLVALDEALERLAEFAPRQTEIIELRFFGGLTMKQTADILDVSERTVHADWSLARAWLLRELQLDGE